MTHMIIVPLFWWFDNNIMEKIILSFKKFNYKKNEKKVHLMFSIVIQNNSNN